MSQSVADLIRKLQQYPKHATVVLPVAFRVEHADGKQAKPLFRWYAGGFDVPSTGDRVRKADYFDTGTIDEISRYDRHLVHVTWDESGESWENYFDLGRAVE